MTRKRKDPVEVMLLEYQLTRNAVQFLSAKHYWSLLEAAQAAERGKYEYDILVFKARKYRKPSKAIVTEWWRYRRGIGVKK